MISEISFNRNRYKIQKHSLTLQTFQKYSLTQNFRKNIFLMQFISDEIYSNLFTKTEVTLSCNLKLNLDSKLG